MQAGAQGLIPVEVQKETDGNCSRKIYASTQQWHRKIPFGVFPNVPCRHKQAQSKVETGMMKRSRKFPWY
jgi:hypothetical protein